MAEVGGANLSPKLLASVPLPTVSGDYHATLDGHGLYNSFQFVLRLSPEIHRKLGSLPNGIVSAKEVGFEGAQAFSTLLHETVHWWQHIGSTYGLMVSLSYPAQAHANYTHLKQIVSQAGFKKSVRQLAEALPGPSLPSTPKGRANVIVNNHFDFAAYRGLSYDQIAAKAIVEAPYFESIGHAYQIAVANNVLILASTADQNFRALQHPRDWEAGFHKLRADKERGFYYGSPVELWPLGAREVFEGQACFIQLQYLFAASGNKLRWSDFRELGMLHGVYVKAFEYFLLELRREWPSDIDHPLVALFLLVCDMAINPGSGFPQPLVHYSSFIVDTDPGARFTAICVIVRLKCPELFDAIREYSRGEYEEVSEKIAKLLILDSPLSIAETCRKWSEPDGPMGPLMAEHRTFKYAPTNLPVRVLFSHFLAFARDKFVSPEIFCWPGIWMAGPRASYRAAELFDRHSALFLDKENDDGIFPRLLADRDQEVVQETFSRFYSVALTYDLTHQWITKSGDFTYDYRWLSQAHSAEEMREFAGHGFEQLYGVQPSAVELLP